MRGRRAATDKDATDARADLPAVSMRTLSKSLHELHEVKYTTVPRAIAVLGVRGLAVEAAETCERDAADADARGHVDLARVLRSAASVYRVAARRLIAPVQEAWGRVLAGDRTFHRPATNGTPRARRTRTP